MLLRDLTTWPLRWAAAMKRSLSHCSAHGLPKSERDYCRGGYIAAENGTPGPQAPKSGGLKNAIGPFLKERMQQRNIWSAIQDLRSRHAKEIRAQRLRLPRARGRRCRKIVLPH
jgi:hypothetical protein